MLHDDQSCICGGLRGRRVGTMSVVTRCVDIANTWAVAVCYDTAPVPQGETVRAENGIDSVV